MICTKLDLGGSLRSAPSRQKCLMPWRFNLASRSYPLSYNTVIIPVSDCMCIVHCVDGGNRRHHDLSDLKKFAETRAHAAAATAAASAAATAAAAASAAAGGRRQPYL